VDLSGDDLVMTRLGGEWTTTARNVEIRWPGAVLKARRAVVWVPGGEKAKPESEGKADAMRLAARFGVAVYAEGDVRVEWRRDRLTCERFFYDFGKGRGVMVRARADLKDAFGKTPVPAGSKLVARAERIRVAMEKDGSAEIALEGASLTDCDFIAPHYDVRVSEVRIHVGPGKEPAIWIDFWHIMPRAFGVPFFYFPWIPLNARWRALIRFQPGRSGEYGAYLRAGVGMAVKAQRRDAPGRTSRLGTFWALGEFFENRGAGGGLEGDWGWPAESPFNGETLLYGVHDRGDRRAVARDRGLFPLEREDRWRAFFYHRHAFPAWFTRADVELNAYSDANFLLEFFEEEWKTEKAPESYLQIREAWAVHGGTLLVRPRLNDFLTRVEYVPRLRYRGVAQPLPLSLGVVTPFLEASHVRIRPDDRNPALRSHRLWRFDAGAEAAAPVRLMILEVEPYLQARYTAFGEGVAVGGSVDRVVLEAGVRGSVQAWRDFDVSSSLLGLQGLRHVATLQADALNRFLVTRPSAELVPVDEVERVDRVQRVDLRLLNRLETWRGEAEARSRRELLFLEIEGSVFPLPERDNGGDRFGPLTFDLRLAPFPGLRFESFSVVDVDRWAFDRWDAGLTLLPWGGVTLTAATSNVPGRLHSTLVRGSIRFNERWSFQFEGMYDFETGQDVFARLTLRRILHRWVLDVGVRFDRSRDDVEFYFSLLPLMAVPEAW
jgi:hypothetical protein